MKKRINTILNQKKHSTTAGAKKEQVVSGPVSSTTTTSKTTPSKNKTTTNKNDKSTSKSVTSTKLQKELTKQQEETSHISTTSDFDIMDGQYFDDEERPTRTTTTSNTQVPLDFSDSGDDDDSDLSDDDSEQAIKSGSNSSSKTNKKNITQKKSSNSPSFTDLGVSQWLEEHLSKLQINMPTVIQEKCIPPTLSGKNVIGMSQTGSGKTAAFALPIIQNLAKDMYGIYALIITPARELAIQIKQHFEVLAGDLPIRVALLVGGMDYLKQAHLLDSAPHIVVGTPGRIEDAIRTFNNDGYFKKIKYLVFDEADRIFSMDYSLDLDRILSVSNPKRQTLLYSATMNNQVKKLAKMAMSNSGKTKEEREENLYIYDACKLFQLADNLSQYYLFMPEHVKDAYFVQLINSLPDNTISIVFFSDITQCELMNQTCRLLGISCDSLHASKSQKERFAVLKYFRKRRLKFLFCTDVANRGLDIPAVGYVINYDLPDTTDKYVHRVGRTARAGRLGVCISLVSQFEVKRVKAIESDTSVQMAKYDNFDEEKAESEEHLLSVAEQKCKAKITLLDSGFYDRFEKVKSKQQLTSDLRKQAQIFFEKRSMDQIKQNSGKWKDRFSEDGANDDTRSSSNNNNNNNVDNSGSNNSLKRKNDINEQKPIAGSSNQGGDGINLFGGFKKKRKQ